MDLVGGGVAPLLHAVLNPGSSTMGIGSGEAGATAPTTIFADGPTGMKGDCAGIGAVTISTGSPYGRGMK